MSLSSAVAGQVHPVRTSTSHGNPPATCSGNGVIVLGVFRGKMASSQRVSLVERVVLPLYKKWSWNEIWKPCQDFFYLIHSIGLLKGINYKLRIMVQRLHSICQIKSLDSLDLHIRNYSFKKLIYNLNLYCNIEFTKQFIQIFKHWMVFKLFPNSWNSNQPPLCIPITTKIQAESDSILRPQSHGMIANIGLCCTGFD